MRLILILLARVQWRLGSYEIERAHACARWQDAAQARAERHLKAAGALVDRARARA